MCTFTCRCLPLPVIFPLYKGECQRFVLAANHVQRNKKVQSSEQVKAVSLYTVYCFLFISFVFFFSPSPCSLIRFPMGRARHLLYTVEDKDKTGCRPCCCVHISSACNSAPRLPLLSPPWNHYGVVFCSVDWLLAWIRVACSSLGANWPTFYIFIFGGTVSIVSRYFASLLCFCKDGQNHNLSTQSSVYNVFRKCYCLHVRTGKWEHRGILSRSCDLSDLPRVAQQLRDTENWTCVPSMCWHVGTTFCVCACALVLHICIWLFCCWTSYLTCLNICVFSSFRSQWGQEDELRLVMKHVFKGILSFGLI